MRILPGISPINSVLLSSKKSKITFKAENNSRNDEVIINNAKDLLPAKKLQKKKTGEESKPLYSVQEQTSDRSIAEVLKILKGLTKR